MNEKLELFLTKFVPYRRWRKFLRQKIRDSYKYSFCETFFGDLKEIMLPYKNDVKVYDGYVEICGIKLKKMNNYAGIAESFGRRDYEFGGIKNCVFVDVGANIGDSSLYAASQPHMDCVYAYEPFFLQRLII